MSVEKLLSNTVITPYYFSKFGKKPAKQKQKKELPDWLIEDLAKQEKQVKAGTLKGSPWNEVKERIRKHKMK